MGPLVEKNEIRKASDIFPQETIAAATANTKSAPKRQLSRRTQTTVQGRGRRRPKEGGISWDLIFHEESLDEGDDEVEGEVEVPPLQVPDKVLIYNGVVSQRIVNEVLGKLTQLEQTIPSNAVERKKIVARAIQSNLQGDQSTNTLTINIDKVCSILMNSTSSIGIATAKPK